MHTIARIFSWVFLPLLAPIYALLIVMFSPSFELNFLQPNSLFVLQSGEKFAIVYIFTLFSLIVPALTILFLRIQGKVGSIMLNDRKERLGPAITTVMCGIALILTINAYVPENMYGFKFIMGLAISSLVTVVVCTAATFRFKISLHAGGMGILCGFLVAYYAHMYEFSLTFILLAFIASGIVMSMRMVLGAHNLMQIVTGYLAGLLLTFFTTVLTMVYL